jgi:hypothetical protein
MQSGAFEIDRGQAHPAFCAPHTKPERKPVGVTKKGIACAAGSPVHLRRGLCLRGSEGAEGSA